MALGRKTGGRTKGVPNKRTAHVEAEIARAGITPLAYMLKVMRNSKAKPERRDWAAAAAAPYVHAKLASVEHSGPNGEAMKVDAAFGLPEPLARALDALAGLAPARSDAPPVQD